jgi:hypothetical protein
VPAAVPGIASAQQIAAGASASFALLGGADDAVLLGWGGDSRHAVPGGECWRRQLAGVWDHDQRQRAVLGVTHRRWRLVSVLSPVAGVQSATELAVGGDFGGSALRAPLNSWTAHCRIGSICAALAGIERVYVD